MSIVSFATTIFFSLIAFGLVLGFFRNWKKSLVRTGILAAAFILSIIFAPIISKVFVSKLTDGSKITFFSQTFDLENKLQEVFGSSGVGELFKEGSVTNELIASFINVVCNVIVFFVLFFVIEFISLIVYWIVCIVLKVKGREDREDAGIEDDEDNQKSWGFRFLGAFFGLLGSVVICFALFTPVFGVMNICNKLVQEETKKTETASAFNAAGYMGSGLYYTEDKNIGKIESYIERYAALKKEYDSSFIGKVFKYSGLNKAGSSAFKRLTTVKQGSLKLNLTNECVNIIQTYNDYKDLFVKDKFDIKNNEDIDGFIALYDGAIESEIIKEYVVEIFPSLAEKWSEDEKYLGLSNPISGDWKGVVNVSLQVFKVDNINRISNNVKAFANAIKVANQYGVIADIEANVKMKDILAENKTLVKDEVLILTSTVELRENISIILNESFEVLYKEVVGEEKDFGENRLTMQQIAELNKTNGWKAEAENIQNTVNDLFNVYDVVEKNGDSEALIDKFETIGSAIDYARNSKLISAPFKTFIEGFVEKKINVDKPEAKQKLLNNIKDETKWNDVSGFSYKKTFKVIQEAALVAKDINKGAENVSLDNLAPAIKDIVEDAGSKEVIADMIKEDIITEFVGEENKDTAEAMTDILETFVANENVTKDTVDADIAAGEQVVNVVNNVKNNGGDLKLGESEAERNAAADKMIEDITSSKAMMETLKESADSTEGSAITDFTTKVSTKDKATLADRIDEADISAQDKETLIKLFGIA